MDIATTLSVCQSVYAAMQSEDVKKMVAAYDKNNVVDELQATISNIIVVLHVAETKEVSHELQDWIEQLKDFVFDADDMFDQVVTQVRAKQRLNKVRLFFSPFSPVVFRLTISRKVRDIKQKLDAIATNHVQLGFKLDPEPLRKKRPEAYAVDIIGREDDLENILRVLLHPNVQRDVSLLTITGIGGLGKTTLAQLVYNDVRVTTAFPLRLWTCVSDQNQETLEIEKILSKIMASATGQDFDASTIDLLQSRLREQLHGRKYLLVLDDMWIVNRDLCRMLVGFLAGGLRGSWVVVTTRSTETISTAGDGSTSTYKLQGLSKDNSLCLFKRAAFGSEDSTSPHDLVEIGQEIVEGCARVPLAIRVVGSLLYGQDKSRWLSFQKIGLSNIGDAQNGIMPILKFSYRYLESALKTCFGYCALFPKDFVIEKKMLISLWMAQGYIIPFDKDQSVEDAAEEYFTILMRRCFFQDAELDEYGEVVSCKIHDLMHDMAEEVAGKDICRTNCITDNLDKRARHLSCMISECAQSSFRMTHIRSLLNFGRWYGAAKMEQFALERVLVNCKYLRALDLSNQDIKSLPSSIARLLHLRYLDLTGNRDLKVLPVLIGELFNLETLKLNGCDRLETLPNSLSKLVNLRILEITDCYSLICMPEGMDRLTCLQMLTEFVLDGASSQHWNDKLEDLKALKYLKGQLVIRVRLSKSATYAKEDRRTEGAYLKNKEHLSQISIRFQKVGERVQYEEALMEELQPHPYLKGLEVCGYHGLRLPRWATFLHNLTRLRLEDCWKLQYLPYLGNLQHLKVLTLVNLPHMEYIIDNDTTLSEDNPEAITPIGLSFFGSLEQLELYHLPELKGWWRGVGDEHQQKHDRRSTTDFHLLCLSQLKSLTINRCPELTSFPLCPRVKDLSLRDCNERLQIMRISVSDLKRLSHCFSGRGNMR